MTHGALSGITVLELGHFYLAPYATMLMAMGGADVIKVEPPSGEKLRYRGAENGAGLPFAYVNSGKRGVTLNLKSGRGREMLLAMAQRADVLVVNYAPGVMERLGLSPEELLKANPRLVYSIGTGYGTTGRYREYPASDITVQAFAGVMQVTGYPDTPPVRAGAAIADFSGGIHLYGAILTALFKRATTGLGSIVETSMLECVYPSLASSLGAYFGSGGDVPPRLGNAHPAVTPYDVYPAKDGYVALMCFSEAHWEALAEAIGQPELATDERFNSGPRRTVNRELVNTIVEQWTRQHNKEDLAKILFTKKVPSSPVRSLDEVAEDENLFARGMLHRINHPEFGEITVPHSPIVFVGEERLSPTPSPGIGQHNDEVYRELLDLQAGELQQLRDEQVI